MTGETQDRTSLTLLQLLAGATPAIRAQMKKTSKAPQGGAKAFGIDEVDRVCGDVFGEWGIITLPSMPAGSLRRYSEPTKSGSMTMFEADVSLRLVSVDDPADFVEVSWSGAGVNPASAASVAVKEVLRHMFHLAEQARKTGPDGRVTPDQLRALRSLLDQAGYEEPDTLDQLAGEAVNAWFDALKAEVNEGQRDAAAKLTIPATGERIRRPGVTISSETVRWESEPVPVPASAVDPELGGNGAGYRPMLPAQAAHLEKLHDQLGRLADVGDLSYDEANAQIAALSKEVRERPRATRS